MNMLRLSHQVILPLYRSSHRSDHESSVGWTLSVRYRGAANPQSTGMKYCCPLNCACLTIAGLSWLKFLTSEVSHGCRVSRLTQSCHRYRQGCATSKLISPVAAFE